MEQFALNFPVAKTVITALFAPTIWQRADCPGTDTQRLNSSVVF